MGWGGLSTSYTQKKKVFQKLMRHKYFLKKKKQKQENSLSEDLYVKRDQRKF